MNVIFYLAGAGFLIFAALFIRWAFRMARRNGKRIAGHGVTLPRRKRRSYKPPKLADLSRDDPDPWWPAYQEWLGNRARDLGDVPSERDPCITKPRSEGESP